ncbi:uncharacterized protein FTOL_06881 [Fusarium torulosum]|uniref:JmjC domain-containing protein n=1 Tax=Fusarium torulosum TaxID=33205 RepID=A0AAE8MAJ1_9HYPO|nr:uncharacterized protein FTOL_06881 [Fusarium torulosum]
MGTKVAHTPITETRHQLHPHICSAPTIHLNDAMATSDFVKKSESVLTTVEKMESDFNALHAMLHNKTQGRNRLTRRSTKQDSDQNKHLLESILPKLDGLGKQLKTLKSQAMDIRAEARSHTLSSAAISANEQAMHQITNGPVMDTQSEDTGDAESAPTRDEQHQGTQVGISEQEVPRQSLGGETSPAQHGQIPDGQSVIQSADTIMWGTGSADELILIPPVERAEGTEDSNSSQPTQLPSALLDSQEDASHASAEVSTSQPTIINGANQAPIAPTTTRKNIAVHLDMEPRNSPRASSHTPMSESPNSYAASGPSPASSRSTELTWPDIPSTTCSPSTTMPGIVHNEQLRPSAAEGPNTATSRCERAIANNQPSKVVRDDNTHQIAKDMTTTDSDATAILHIQTHSPEGDAEHQQVQSSLALNASRDGGDPREEGAGLDVRPKRTMPTSTITARSTLPTITLSNADMDRLVDKLGELACDHTLPDGAKQHLSVPRRTVDLRDVQNSINTNAGTLQYTSIRYEAGPNGKGDTRVHASHKVSHMDWSGFTAETKRPTIEQAKEAFETIAQNPPEEEIPYYVGHLDILRDTPPDPGPLITGDPDFKDLHTPYSHIGGYFSANRMHNEDMTFMEETAEGLVFHGLRSYNEVYFGTGFKLWLVIKRHHIAKFDAFVKANWKCNDCNHAVSHQDILFAPSILERAGIEYNITVVGCGEAFWTLPGQQHQVLNIGYCAAVSINFALPDDNLDPKRSIQCSDCGMFEVAKKRGATIVPALSSETVKNRRKRNADEEIARTSAKRMTRTNTGPGRELKAVMDKLSTVTYNPPVVNVASVSNAEVAVFSRVAAIRSTVAVQQLIDVTKEYRKQQSQSAFTNNPDHSSLDQAVASVGHYMGRTRLDKICLRLAQRRLAQEAEKTRAPMQLQLDAAFLSELASRHDMAKEELKRHLQEGGQWRRVCGAYHGLLPFIPLDSHNAFQITKQKWIELSRKDNNDSLRVFHSLLDDEYTMNLCAAGEMFESIISGASVAFIWEGNGIDLDATNVDVLLKTLA